MPTPDRLRFGLVGTGFWADETHARALVHSDHSELVAVWGRDQDKAARVADRWDARAVAELDDLFDRVDAVSFAVPPDVQATMAPRAAAAGCHVLLEKPIARSREEADALSDAVRDAGVASMVFFTWRLDPEVAAWVEAHEDREVHGGAATWFGSIFTGDSPFDTPWRREPAAALWDVGPHALSVLLPVLGPVAAVDAATHDDHGTVRLLLSHRGGASSTVAVSLRAPEAVGTSRVQVHGPDGWSTSPPRSADSWTLLVRAVDRLAASAAGRSDHEPLDAAFGAEVVHVLVDAAAQLDGSGRDG